MALPGRGRFDEAIAHFQKALEIKPDFAEAHNNLGIARSQWEGILKALAERRELLRSRPDDIALLNDTAWVLATNPNASIRNGAEAIELAQRAVQLSDGREPAVLGTLAAAYAEAGRFPEAVQTARAGPGTGRQPKQRGSSRGPAGPRSSSTRPVPPIAKPTARCLAGRAAPARLRKNWKSFDEPSEPSSQADHVAWTAFCGTGRVCRGPVATMARPWGARDSCSLRRWWSRSSWPTSRPGRAGSSGTTTRT